jgi:cysteine-rich repeat protein
MIAAFRSSRLLLGGMLAVAACGGSSVADGGNPDQLPADADADMDRSFDDVGPEATDAADDTADTWPDLHLVPACGNGLLEDGEACDDGNRVDGDECDWTCRTGPGEPAGPPDPAAESFEPDGEAASVEGVAIENVIEFLGSPIPLVWNGSSLATVVRESVDGGAAMRVRFHRFLPDGSSAGPDWFYAADGWAFGWLDLVWTGGGYGLFFSHVDVGACLQRLEADGKPLGPPIVIVPDGLGSEADRIDGGFVALYRGPANGLELARFGDDGTRRGPPLALCDEGGNWSNVAAGSSGIASLGECNDPHLPHGASTPGLFLLSPEADRVLGVEWLDNRTRGGTVGRTDDGFYAAWDRMGIFPRTFCVGRFGPDGTLLRSPGCTTLAVGWDGLLSWAEGVQADRDDDGLGMAFAANNTLGFDCSDQLLFVRTDADGRAVGAPINVLGPDAAGKFDGLNVAWAGDSYVVLVKVAECSFSDITGYPAGLYVRRFVPAAP